MIAGSPISRRGLTLVELVISLAITSLILVGLASSLMIAARAVDVETSAEADPHAGIQELSTDIGLAIAIDTSPTEIVLTVPDRDTPPDGQPETIRYGWSGQTGDPLERQYNGGTPRPIITSTDDFTIDLHQRTVSGSKTTPALDPNAWGYFGGDSEELGLDVLLVVIDADLPSAAATARQSLLESWQCTVKLISQDATPAEFASAVSANQVIYVAAEVDETVLGSTLRDAARGLVNGAYKLHDELGFAGSAALRGDTKTAIVDNTHTITLGSPTGNATIVDSSQQLVRLTATSAGLVTLSETSGDSSLVVLDAAGVMHGGGTAAARRVQMPWGRTDFDFNSLNATGLGFLRRSLRWASETPFPDTAGHDAIGSAPVTHTRKVQIASQISLAESGVVSSITAYIDTAGSKYRFAIYDDVGGEPDALLAESNEAEDGGTGWRTIPIPPTPLTAGSYWLALAFEDDAQWFFHDAPGETRYRAHDAVRNGFRDTWDASDQSYLVKLSIYATYIPN